MPKVIYIDQDNEKSFTIPDRSNLYLELKKQDFDLKHGCLAGVCGVCRIEILEGSEFCHPPSELELDTLNAVFNGNDITNIRLACRLIIKEGVVKFRSSLQ